MDFLDGIESVDTLTNPEEASAAAQRLVSDEVENVLVESPPAGNVTLPGGYLDNEGTLFKSAEVRELTGEDEEALAKSAASRNMNRVLNTILLRGVVAVGPYPADASLLDTLLVGDRDALILGIRIATYGHELDLEVECPHCNNGMEVTYDLNSDVPMKTLDVDRRLFEVELKNGRKVEVMLPNGHIQSYLANSQAKTSAELNTVLLSQCVESIDGERVVGSGPLKKMGMQDRRTLLKFINEMQPGPQYDEVKQECDACAREFPLVIDLGDLFRG